MSTVTTTIDGRPCRVTTRADGVEERAYLDTGDGSGWRTATFPATQSAVMDPPEPKTPIRVTVLPKTALLPPGSKPPTAPALEPIRRWLGSSCVTVHLHEKAIDGISRSSFLSGLDGLETGGWLRGEWTGSELHIYNATSADLVREAYHLELSDDPHLELLAPIGKGRIGIWHSHPSGDWRPSPSDFDAWESGLAVTSRGQGDEPYYIGIIVTGDQETGTLARPVLQAWATRLEDGRYITEPAEIVQAA